LVDEQRRTVEAKKKRDSRKKDQPKKEVKKEDRSVDQPKEKPPEMKMSFEDEDV